MDATQSDTQGGSQLAEPEAVKAAAAALAPPAMLEDTLPDTVATERALPETAATEVGYVAASPRAMAVNLHRRATGGRGRRAP